MNKGYLPLIDSFVDISQKSSQASNNQKPKCRGGDQPTPPTPTNMQKKLAWRASR